MEVLYEDNHLIAVNKPAGVLAQGDKTGDETLGDEVKVYIKEKYQKPGEVFLGLVHRIDRPVSGVMLFSRTSKALSRMNEMFKTREVQKTYLAIVENAPPKSEDILIGYLIKNERQNKSYTTSESTKGALRCELSYKLLAKSDRYFLLEVKPQTGRHHQIRVQLSSIGCVIKGDLKYGAKRSNKDASICLHAHSVEFIHPVKKDAVRVVAPLPNTDVWPFFSDVVRSLQ